MFETPALCLIIKMILEKTGVTNFQVLIMITMELNLIFHLEMCG